MHSTIRSSLLITLLYITVKPAQAAFEYRFIEAEAYTVSSGGGIRNEGFTEWMRHPSHGKVIVLPAGSRFEYDVPILGTDIYHLFLRGLAVGPGAAVDVYWDGEKIGRTEYPKPATALRWSREVGIVRGPGSHHLELVPVAGNVQTPYIDVMLLTNQSDYRPDDQDADFQSLDTTLPLLRLKDDHTERAILPSPGGLQSSDSKLDIKDITADTLGVGSNEIAVRIVNRDSRQRTLVLAIRMSNKERRASTLINPSETTRINIPLEISAPGNQTLNIRLMENDRTIIEGNYPINIVAPLRVALDSYAYPLGSSQARWNASLADGANSLQGLNTELWIEAEGSNTRIGQRILAFSGSASETSFDLSSLPVGRYTVRSRISWSGRLLQEDRHAFAIFRPAPPDTWEPVRSTHVVGDTVYLNDKPFLGRLLYHASIEPNVHQQGYNLVQCYGEDPDPLPSIQKQLDDCRQSGLWGVVVLFNNRHFRSGKDFNLENLRTAVLRFRNHPALWGWDLIDEPDANTVPPAVVSRAAQIIRSLDPNHVIWVNLSRPDQAFDYLASQNLWSYDYYPLPHLGPYAHMTWLRLIDRQLRGRVPLGVVMQAFTLHGRMPTPEELRCIAYLHIIHGFKWFSYYSYYEPAPAVGLSRNPILWSFTRMLNSELQELSPVILDSAKYTVVPADPGSDTLQAVQKVVNGQKYLFVVNCQVRAATVRLRVTGATATPMFEQVQAFPIRDGVLEQSFPPYGVRVYQIR